MEFVNAQVTRGLSSCFFFILEQLACLGHLIASAISVTSEKPAEVTGDWMNQEWLLTLIVQNGARPQEVRYYLVKVSYMQNC